MITCLTCSNLNLQQHRDHAKVGFGKCVLEPSAGVFESIFRPHECAKYLKAPQEVIDARQAWADKQKGNK